MAKTTANLGLVKPERSDNYSVDVMANNMDIIDTMVAPKTVVYTVTFSDIFVDFAAGGVTYTTYTGGSSIILQPLPTVTYNCPSTITLNVTNRPAGSSYKSNAGGTVKLYTYDGSAWTLFSSKATEYQKTYSIELAFPTSTKGVWITMAGGNGFSIAHPLPIII